MERTLEPIRRQHLEISRAFEVPGAIALIQGIVSANQHWLELIKQTSAASVAGRSLSSRKLRISIVSGATVRPLPSPEVSAKR